MASDAVSPRKNEKNSDQQLSPEQAAAAAMISQARREGLDLTGPGGLLKVFTKNVLETALNEEMTERLGHERDRAGTFTSQIVKKRQRRLGSVDEIVLSLYVKRLTTGEIVAHFADIYGATVSKDTISTITDKVVAEMDAWSGLPSDAVYAPCSSTRSM